MTKVVEIFFKLQQNLRKSHILIHDNKQISLLGFEG